MNAPNAPLEVGYQRTVLLGTLGGDPVKRIVGEDQTLLCTFSVNVVDEYKARDGATVRRSIWLQVAAWNDLATFVVEHGRKGAYVFVRGVLEPREHKGVERLEVRALHVEFVGDSFVADFKKLIQSKAAED
jgi:single-stranded DNA-binding protein